MHPLRNGSQVIARPARKTTAGTPGYFSESNDNNQPSYPGQDWFNDVIDEFANALAAANITYMPGDLTHLAQLFAASGKSSFIKYNLFRGMPMSAVGPTPDPDIFLPAGRVELNRDDYPTVFDIVSASAFYISQATIDADPRQYAGYWGDGDGVDTFTTDDWALMMHLKVAGSYGSSGSTKEDHIQNIVGTATPATNTVGYSLHIRDVSGVFATDSIGTTVANISATAGTGNTNLSFDASRVARTSNFTDTMGLFLDHYRVIPKGVFSYA
ncbi:hypothetical protein U5315_002673 [Vibrio fluvialis]|nr:hypothetical protein [Vibrio fluvialis]